MSAWAKLFVVIICKYLCIFFINMENCDLLLKNISSQTNRSVQVHKTNLTSQSRWLECKFIYNCKKTGLSTLKNFDFNPNHCQAYNWLARNVGGGLQTATARTGVQYFVLAKHAFVSFSFLRMLRNLTNNIQSVFH